jgi:hypothetical protein
MAAVIQEAEAYGKWIQYVEIELDYQIVIEILKE